MKRTSYLVGSLLLVVAFVFASPAHSFTRSPFVITTDVAGDWRIISIHPKIYESPLWDMLGRVNALCVVCDSSHQRTVRHSWYEYKIHEESDTPLIVGPWIAKYGTKLTMIKLRRAKALRDALSSVLGNEIFAFSYFGDIDEALVYLAPERWGNPMAYAFLMYEINKKRDAYLKKNPALDSSQKMFK